MASTFSGNNTHPGFQHLVNANIVLEIGALVICPIIIFCLRKHPLLHARKPYVVNTEIIVGSLACLLIAFTQESPPSIAWLQEDQSGYNCAYGNFVYTIVVTAPFHIILARIVLFYRIAQANSCDISRKQDFFDRLIHYIGLAIAPKDFVRAEHRLQALQRMRDANDLFAVEVEDMSGIAQTRFRQHLVFYCELACWLLKMGAWWCLWGAGCVLCMLFSTSQRRAITQNTTTGTALYGEDFDCGVFTWNVFVQSYFIYWNCLQLIIVVIVYRRIKEDSLGMSGELLWMQSLFSILWFAVAIGLFFKSSGLLSDLEAHSVIGMRLLSALMLAIFAFFYPMLLIVKQAVQERKLQSTNTQFRTAAQVERFWHTSYGRQRIDEIARDALSIEIPLFLQASMSTSGKCIPETQARYLHDTFIKVGAPFELNLSGPLKTRWREGVGLPELYPSLVDAARSEVFDMITKNFQSALSATPKKYWPTFKINLFDGPAVVQSKSLFEVAPSGDAIVKVESTRDTTRI